MFNIRQAKEIFQFDTQQNERQIMDIYIFCKYGVNKEFFNLRKTDIISLMEK